MTGGNRRSISWCHRSPVGRSELLSPLSPFGTYIGATRQPRRRARFGLPQPWRGSGHLHHELAEVGLTLRSLRRSPPEPCARECHATRSGPLWLPEPERELDWFGAGCLFMPGLGPSDWRRCKNLHRCVHRMCSWLTCSTAVSVRVAVCSTARQEVRRCAQQVEALPSEPDRRATRHSLGGQAVWLADPDGDISGA